MITIFNGRSRGLGSQKAKDIYVQVSVNLRKYLNLFKGAKLNVFLAIALHGDSQGWSKPSTRTLRRETGLSSDTIFKALAELCELEVEGHRVLLRRGVRRTGGQFSSNNYLIFPTEDEVAKFETPYLFACGPQYGGDQQPTSSTVSEKPGMAPGAYIEPSGRAPKRADGSSPRSSPSSPKSRFELEDIRKYAWSRDEIRNPDGWSITARRSGEADDLIEEFLKEWARVRNDNTLPGPFETACQAVELAMSVNEISLAEAIARLREASLPAPAASRAEAAEAWLKVLAVIRSRLQQSTFETWFDSIRCEGIDGTNRRVILWAPNQAVSDWVKVNYSNLMDQALSETGLAAYAIHWISSAEVVSGFREMDEAIVQRVINYFVKERGYKYELVQAKVG